MPCASWPRRGTGRTAGTWKRSGWHSRSEKVLISRELFDGSLYGELDLERAGKESNVALPPYFPVDRNEAYIAAGTPDLPANAVSKYLGLAWRIHRREVLPVLERITPYLRAPELQQAADDILERMSEPETAELVAELATKTSDPVHPRELFALLARRLAGGWNSARDRPKVLQVDSARARKPRDASARDRAGGRDAGRALSRDARGNRPGCQGARGGAGGRRGGDRLVSDHAQPRARATGLVGAGQAELELGGRGGGAGHGASTPVRRDG